MRAARSSESSASIVQMENETRQILANLSPLVEAIAGTFGSKLEVVLHDLRTPEHSIVAIANGAVTGREVGGPIIGGPTQDKALRLLRERGDNPRLLANYSTRTPDGRELKSTSVVYYSGYTGEPIAALCLNYDLTGFQAAMAALETFLRTDGPSVVDSSEPGQKQRTDLESMIRSMINRSVAETGKPVALMSKDEKSSIVATLDENGLFMIRGAVERVAHVLGISRFTVYNYLKESRNRS